MVIICERADVDMSLARSNIVLTSVIGNGMLLIFDRYIHRSGNDMAADKQPEKTVNIQSSVNVGTATGETAVSGAKVSVGSVQEVHVHGATNPPRLLRRAHLPPQSRRRLHLRPPAADGALRRA
jgi:hypothetical protein